MKVLDESEPLRPCRCPDCECTNTTDLLVGDGATPMCGCCLADCPQVHGPEGRRQLRDMAQTGESPPAPRE